jgi:hypothetical protein
MSHLSKAAAPVVALVLSVATLTLSVNALASPTTTTTLSPRTVTAGEEYAAALLARQPIPPAARLVTALPTPLPPSGGVTDDTAATAHHEYELAPSVSVDQYVESHLPVGEHVSGTGTGGGPGTPTTHTLTLSANCASPHVTYCDVSYATIEVNGQQELRVDVQVVWLPIVHVLMPTSGLVTVTGFDTTSLVRGSSGPASVVLSARQARQLSQQIQNLKDMSQNVNCMEDSALLDIKVTQGTTVLWSAIADECPGELRITSGAATHLLDDRSCAFWHVVNAFFPAGTATATKTDSADVCADTENG